MAEELQSGYTMADSDTNFLTSNYELPALLVATGVEVAQSNSQRHESIWMRIGGFALSFMAADFTMRLIDRIFGNKKPAPAEAVSVTNDAAVPSLVVDNTPTTWAKDIAEEKSCGCGLRK